MFFQEKHLFWANILLFLLDVQAAILQQTAEYIFTLEQEKTQLLAQNNQLKRFIQVCVAFLKIGSLSLNSMNHARFDIKFQL